MPALVIRFSRGGVYLPQLRLWLDSHQSQPGADMVFVSHAHSDHARLHREVILSEPTSRLMHARLAGNWLERVLPFHTPADLPGGETPFRMTLLPAGHVFGSAMGLIQAENESLLYTGDFKLKPGLSAEPCEPRSADILIMETTYGRPGYRFPPVAEVMQGVIRFCREALDNDETPVLLGYSLGKSQEILRAIGDAGLPIMLHAQIYKLTRIYEELGQSFPAYTKYDSSTAKGKVLLCPPNAASQALIRNLGRTRTAILTGWAVDSSCRYRYGADAAFPLSDHADFPDLIELVKRVNPKKVFTLHGFAADFAQTLRELGYDAQSLSEEEQLSLPLAVPVRKPRVRPAFPEVFLQAEGRASNIQEGSGAIGEGSAEEGGGVEGGFQAFAEISSRIGSTSKKLEKISILSDYFKALSPEALNCTAVWFTGHPFAPSQNKALQLGWALIRDGLCQAGGLDQAEFGQVYLKHSDLGETALEILSKVSPARPSLDLQTVGATFEQLHSTRGALAKLPVLLRVLRQATALEGKFLIKILTGDLRIGLKEGLVEEAIARTFQAPLEEVRNANLLLGNVGETARLAARNGLGTASLEPFRPVKFMLASPEGTAGAIWERVQGWSSPRNSGPAIPQSGAGHAVSEVPIPSAGPLSLDATPVDPAGTAPRAEAWIEDKYDGIRCQLHKVGERVAIYSRDLKEITGAFLEIADAARAVDVDLVVDGEILAMRGDQVLPFAELQRRLGRREGDLFLGMEIPVQLVAFDLLWLNGKSALNEPLRVRRQWLDRIQAPPFRVARVTRAGAADQIDAAFSAARLRGNEGLMIKDPESEYLPGGRGLAWLKLKKALATLDCVVVGAEYGHGKRKAVLSDYTFAVRDDRTGELKTIGKSSTGLTEVEIAELTVHFLGKTRGQTGRYLEVEPDTVLEIAFDVLQPSARHTSGLAMRFPRIVRIRRDKAPNQIDTVAVARRLVPPNVTTSD